MSKFNVGDKVKIREDLIYDHYYGDIRCSSKRLECRGKIGEITKIAKTGSYFVHNHWFSEEMLEACDSKNTSKFKVGDIIKCVKNHDYLYVNKKLKKAQVLDINCNEMKLEILEHSFESIISDIIICAFENFEEYFELFEKEDNVESLYPYMIDIKTCGKNSLDNFKIQTDFYDKYIKGVWKKEEEKDMNKVVNLWYERKRNKIIDKYDELEAEFNTTKYSVVESFTELVQRFNEDLESLYKMDKATEQFVLKENAPNNVVKYCVDYERIDKEFEEEYRNKRDEELKEIKDIKDEVEAQLSLSNDLEYQQEVLIRYSIIDKKTKKIAD